MKGLTPCFGAGADSAPFFSSRKADASDKSYNVHCGRGAPGSEPVGSKIKEIAVKKILVIGAVAMLAVATGCSNKKKTAAGSGSVLTPPPQPQHPVAAAPVSAEPVTPVTYEPAPMPAAGAGPAAGSTYTVQKGDTLWNIATRAYGNGQQFRKIVAANPSIKGERVNIGQKITIPQ